jgi:hypothetical protein
MIESTIKSKLFVPVSPGQQSTGEIVKRLTVCYFSIQAKLASPNRTDNPDFDWSKVKDVLDRGIPTQSEWSMGFYTPFFRDVVETGVAAHDLTDSTLQWMTLAERLLLEEVFFTQTRMHLDERTITICAGSRFGLNNTFAPTVYKNRAGPGICIGYTEITTSVGNTGPRQVWRTI